MTPRLSEAERIARKLDPPPALPSTPSAELLSRIAPRPPVAKSPPYIEPLCIEEQLAAGVPIADIATAKAAQWRAGDPAAWVTAVEAVAALIAAEPPADEWFGAPELAPPPARKSKLQPIEDLVAQRVPRHQGVGIISRFYGLNPWDANLATAAFDLVARALDISPPGSAAATLAADADDTRRKQLGLRDDQPMYDPFAGRQGMPRPLDVLDAQLAHEARQRAERAAEEAT
ncbi:MAG TPA: hypothetical protein VMV69_28600 [Pirellulales bacterium]|nr:hypothetical protein [Pirellulales bacterium]